MIAILWSYPGMGVRGGGVRYWRRPRSAMPSRTQVMGRAAAVWVVSLLFLAWRVQVPAWSIGEDARP